MLKQIIVAEHEVIEVVGAFLLLDRSVAAIILFAKLVVNIQAMRHYAAALKLDLVHELEIPVFRKFLSSWFDIDQSPNKS